MNDTKIRLSEKDIPKRWYNISPDLPVPPAPYLIPKLKKTLSTKLMKRLGVFSNTLLEQEDSMEPWIDIPDKLIETYKMWRPTPLVRAVRLEKALKTKARIYYKDESVSPPGSHKPNTSVAQAYYCKLEGVKRIVTETGAGQWGSAMAFACNLVGLECQVYMVRISFEQKPFRKTLMQSWGANVTPSPSMNTRIGRRVNKKEPGTPGSLGLAGGECMEEARKRKDTRYALGSFLNYVLMHQTIIGLEVKKQLKLAGEKGPDILIAPLGAGSNFAGIVFPFVNDKIKKGKDIRFIGAEPMSCPKLTKGVFRYDYGDTTGKTPLILMYTLGHSFTPPPIHAGGLRYHGCAPTVSLLVKDKIVEPKAYHQNACFEAGVLFARTEGMVPAPETTHAIRAVVDEAKAATQEKVIVFNYTGHGHLDLAAYEKYLSGKLEDYELSEEEIKKALKKVPYVKIPEKYLPKEH